MISMADVREEFLKKYFIPLLEKLQKDKKGQWGKMNAQQMVEHLADSVKNASGKLILPLVNTGESLQKSRDFLMSDHSFKQEIKNPLIPEEGFPLRKADLESAIDKLQKELNYFFEIFEKHTEMKTRNPIFGELDYKMNLQLLNKHFSHHLRQFGIL
jgi:hypothetical protein